MQRLHQRDVFGYRNLLGTALHVKGPAKAARGQPLPQRVAQQLAALAECHLHQLAEQPGVQRRKLLRHTLGQWLAARGFGGTFDVQRRAEEVPVAEYVALVQALQA